MIPRSRGGGGRGRSNIKMVPAKIHQAWHDLFDCRLTATPKEAVEQIREWNRTGFFDSDGKLTDKFNDEQQEDWRLVFGDAKPEEAVKIVEICWSPRNYFK